MAELIVEMHFMLFSAYNTAYNGLKISEYEAYWLADFPLKIYWKHAKK